MENNEKKGVYATPFIKDVVLKDSCPPLLNGSAGIRVTDYEEGENF